MALANVVRTSIHAQNQWNQSILDQNLIEGDDIYGEIYSLTAEQENALSIPESAHLMVRNFDVINQDFSMYSKNFSIEYNENPALFGCLMDSVNRKDGIGNTLNDSMQNLFNDHSAGILIAEGKSYGVIYHGEKYYFIDSQSCGIKGAPAKNSNDKACIVECDTINELTRICKRATGSRRVQYTLDHIYVQFNHNPIQDLHIVELLSLKEPTPLNVEQ
ncbi:unnamed protein product [Macrosiphum euphorbiae]|uniref:Uncharacterized protein n=1 Tax=Macrosiphum euphorbiae TaxID=13131 RepID=A0AAV0XPM6_9HEMI|nr:unnamed protein product [Macrosiphum euphorbiae]